MARGGDTCGTKKRKGSFDSWGRSDKSSRERQRIYARDKKDEKKRRNFERAALAELHPQVCPICLHNEMTHLLVNCGMTAKPYHRYHGVCADCLPYVQGLCPVCRGPVQFVVPTGTAIFAP